MHFTKKPFCSFTFTIKMGFLQNNFRTTPSRTLLHCMLFPLLQEREGCWFTAVRSPGSRGRERMRGQEHHALGLSFAMSQNLMNAHSQHSRFPMQRTERTYFRSREITHINKKKKGIKKLYDSDTQTNIIQKEDPCKLAGVQSH